jgi:NifU-like protein involved in Fe-S cluster formation
MMEQASSSLESARQVTGHGGNPPGQGPFMKIHLTLKGEVVLKASYETYLCPACHDCGKALCEMVAGKALEELGKIDRQALAERVGPLPSDKTLCYCLAVLALADAVKRLGEERAPGEGASR